MYNLGPVQKANRWHEPDRRLLGGCWVASTCDNGTLYASLSLISLYDWDSSPALLLLNLIYGQAMGVASLCFYSPRDKNVPPLKVSGLLCCGMASHNGGGCEQASRAAAAGEGRWVSPPPRLARKAMVQERHMPYSSYNPISARTGMLLTGATASDCATDPPLKP
jgi:hypothetical protein